MPRAGQVWPTAAHAPGPARGGSRRPTNRPCWSIGQPTESVPTALVGRWARPTPPCMPCFIATVSLSWLIWTARPGRWCATSVSGPGSCCTSMSKSKVVSLMVVATASTGAGAPAEGAVAVVGRPWQLRSRSSLAGVCPPVRPETHHPILQADTWVDNAQATPSRAGRPLDLAGAGRLRPAAPGPRCRGRSTAAVGTAPTPAATVALSGAPRVSAAVVCTRLAGCCAEPSGCSPGRPKGCYSGPATRYPAIKKPTKKPRKEPPTTAKAA